MISNMVHMSEALKSKRFLHYDFIYLCTFSFYIYIFIYTFSFSFPYLFIYILHIYDLYSIYVKKSKNPIFVLSFLLFIYLLDIFIRIDNGKYSLLVWVNCSLSDKCFYTEWAGGSYYWYRPTPGSGVGGTI